MSKRRREQAEGEAIAQAVRWFQATHEGETVMLALLTDDGPEAFAMSAISANLMGDALRDAAQTVVKERV